MKTTNNTILITGGSAGIGFALAQKLIAEGNRVIIVGRTLDRLQQAAASLGDIPYIRADVTNEQEARELLQTVYEQFPQLNILINNAGAALYADLVNDAGIYEKASTEITTNYLSTIRLIELFLPLLKMQKEAAIANVSSVTAFVPSLKLATYAASKAALHSYTTALRLALEDTAVNVFEIMPPLVNTGFSAEIGGENGIPPSQVADEFFEALGEDRFEVRVAGTENLYRLFLSDPAQALLLLNKRG